MIPMPTCYSVGNVIPFPFDTYGSSNESITITGLAVTDIEIYRLSDDTLRSSDNGYTLSDTDGIDYKGHVGVHGFTVDTGDNSHVSFWVNGDNYRVIVDAVTIDGQTVRFSYLLALGFSLKPTIAGRTLDIQVTGEADVNVTLWNGSAVATPTVAGVPEVEVTYWGGANSVSFTNAPEMNVTYYNSFAANSNANNFPEVALAQIIDTALTETSGGYLASAFIKLLDVATPVMMASDAVATAAKLLAYFQLTLRSDAAITADNATELAEINANEGSGAGDYAATDESQEALRDTGDVSWIPPVGYATAEKLLAYVQLLARSDGAVGTDNATELAEINADGGSGGGDYTATGDSQEAILKRGNAQWQTITAAAIRTALGLAAANMDTQLGTIGTNAARLTAVRADVLTDWIDGNRLDLLLDAIKVITDALTAAAASKLALSAGTIVTGAAEAGTLSTTQMTTNLTEATSDHFNGRILIWTSGALQYQATDITDYAGASGLLTYTATTEAPSAADTFAIL